MKLKTKLSLLILLIIFFLAYFFFFKHAHLTGFEPKKYSWIFNNSIREEVENDISSIEKRKEDLLMTYLYKDFNFTILEINNVKFKINEIKYNKNISFEQFEQKFYGEILNKDVLPFPEVWISYKMNFDNKIEINLDEYSEIDSLFSTSKYNGFIGKVYKMGLSSINYKNLIMFDYKFKPEKTLFVFYKYHERNIIIIINSKKDFGIEAINLLNLE